MEELTTFETIFFFSVYWLGGFIPVLLAFKAVKILTVCNADVEGRKVSMGEVGLSFLLGWASIISGAFALVIIIIYLPMPKWIEMNYQKLEDKLTSFRDRKLF